MEKDEDESFDNDDEKSSGEQNNQTESEVFSLQLTKIDRTKSHKF